MSTLTSIITSIHKREDLTQDVLKSLLTYNPDTGIFTWNGDANARVMKGDEAGTKAKGYRYITINGIKFAAHRLAFLYMEGYMPDEVDHDDRCKWNNGWNNLKASDRRSNNANKEDSIVFIFNGMKQCLKHHCQDIGVNYNTVLYRINAMGMSPQEALSYGL